MTDPSVMSERRRQALEESWQLRDLTPAFPVECLAPVCPDGRLSVRNLMHACGVSQYRAERWRRAGRLNVYEADEAAIRAGLHPSQVWPEWSRCGEVA